MQQPEVQPSELVEHAAQVVENLCQAANLSQAEHILLAATPEQRSTEPYMRIQAGILVAERKVQSLVTLVVDEGTEHEAKLAKSIKESPAAAVRGSCELNQYVAIVVDGKVLCESGSQAKWRLPPTRPSQIKRLLGSFISTRDEGELDDADVLVGLDAGKGNEWEEKQLLKHLPGKKYSCTKHIVIFNHASVEKRMERASKAPLDLTESLSFTTTGSAPVSVKAGPFVFNYPKFCGRHPCLLCSHLPGEGF